MKNLEFAGNSGSGQSAGIASKMEAPRGHQEVSLLNKDSGMVRSATITLNEIAANKNDDET